MIELLAGQGANFYVQNPGFFPREIALDAINVQFDEAALKANLKIMEENLKVVQQRLKEQEIVVGEYYSARKSAEEANAEAKRQKKDWEAQKAKMLEQQRNQQQKQEQRLAREEQRGHGTRRLNPHAVWSIPGQPLPARGRDGAALWFRYCGRYYQVNPCLYEIYHHYA